MRRSHAATAAAAAVAVAAAGCVGPAAGPPAADGNVQPASTTPATLPAGATATTAAADPGPGRCRAADLAAAVLPGDAGAGQRHATAVLTNRAAWACQLLGYGGLALAGPGGAPVPAAQDRDPATPPQAVLLRPGRSAWSALTWTAIPSDGEPQIGDCEPAPATLLITPPDDTVPVTAPWTLGPVCDAGRVGQGAWRPAPAPP